MIYWVICFNIFNIQETLYKEETKFLIYQETIYKEETQFLIYQETLKKEER